MSKKMNFEQSLGRLEEISELLADEQTSLEQSLDLYKEATKLVSDCTQQLKNAELTVHQMDVLNDNEISE